MDPSTSTFETNEIFVANKSYAFEIKAQKKNRKNKQNKKKSIRSFKSIDEVDGQRKSKGREFLCKSEQPVSILHHRESQNEGEKIGKNRASEEKVNENKQACLVFLYIHFQCEPCHTMKYLSREATND
jgi:hypothetical protein